MHFKSLHFHFISFHRHEPKFTLLSYQLCYNHHKPNLTAIFFAVLMHVISTVKQTVSKESNTEEQNFYKPSSTRSNNKQTFK